MFVLIINKSKIKLPQILIPILFKYFVFTFYRKYNIKLNLDFRGTLSKYEIYFVDNNYDGYDWCPQFSIRTCNKNKSIYIPALKFPEELTKQGIGTFCINWLKLFSSLFHYDYIILGSYGPAIGFWLKQGFSRIADGDDTYVYY